MVRRLIQHQHRRFRSERRSDLPALSFSRRKRVPPGQIAGSESQFAHDSLSHSITPLAQALNSRRQCFYRLPAYHHMRTRRIEMDLPVARDDLATDEGEHRTLARAIGADNSGPPFCNLK